MAFCSKCGAQMGEGEKFCPNCGQAADTGTVLPNSNDDVQQNKGMAVLSYIGPLVFIPLLTKKDSPYAQFHAKQGFTLFVVDVVAAIVNSLLGLIKVTRDNGYFTYRATPWFITLITSVISIAIAVIAIIGIVNAVKGQEKKLPIIGDIDIYSMFFKK